MNGILLDVSVPSNAEIFWNNLSPDSETEFVTFVVVGIFIIGAIFYIIKRLIKVFSEKDNKK